METRDSQFVNPRECVFFRVLHLYLLSIVCLSPPFLYLPVFLFPCLSYPLQLHAFSPPNSIISADFLLSSRSASVLFFLIFCAHLSSASSLCFCHDNWLCSLHELHCVSVIGSSINIMKYDSYWHLHQQKSMFKYNHLLHVQFSH